MTKTISISWAPEPPEQIDCINIIDFIITQSFVRSLKSFCDIWMRYIVHGRSWNVKGLAFWKAFSAFSFSFDFILTFALGIRLLHFKMQFLPLNFVRYFTVGFGFASNFIPIVPPICWVDQLEYRSLSRKGQMQWQTDILSKFVLFRNRRLKHWTLKHENSSRILVNLSM